MWHQAVPEVQLDACYALHRSPAVELCTRVVDNAAMLFRNCANARCEPPVLAVHLADHFLQNSCGRAALACAQWDGDGGDKEEEYQGEEEERRKKKEERSKK